MSSGFITKRGLLKLQSELHELKAKRRPEVAEKLRVALSFGDISENPEYAEAKEEQAFVEGRIAEIESILRSSLLVQTTPERFPQVAAIGCALEVRSGSKMRKFVLVGKGEGDPVRGEISSDSPLGQALIGKKVGTIIKVSTPSGKRHYKITGIS